MKAQLTFFLLLLVLALRAPALPQRPQLLPLLHGSLPRLHDVAALLLGRALLIQDDLLCSSNGGERKGHDSVAVSREDTCRELYLLQCILGAEEIRNFLFQKFQISNA